MAYALHIERNEQEISLEEWLSALESVAGVRQQREDIVGINPKTGEEIRIVRDEGDAEVMFSNGGILGFGRREEWSPAFRFSNGRASFKATREIDSPQNPVRKAAVQLAAALAAEIVGDEGERYDW